jgi:hypothetical protein
VTSEIFVVLGMHKSGTTLVSEMLHRSGIAMVERDVEGGYERKNYFEREATKALNKELLRCGGRSSLKVRRRLGDAIVDPGLSARAKAMVAQITRDCRSWGFKDPRTCLTYEFWKTVLPPHRLICVFRSDAEVHGHYTRGRGLSLRRGMDALAAWHAYNACIVEAAGEAGDRAILVSYESLMDGDAEFSRLQRFVGRELADCRRPGLHRARTRHGFRISRWLARIALGADTAALHEELTRLRRAQVGR